MRDAGFASSSAVAIAPAVARGIRLRCDFVMTGSTRRRAEQAAAPRENFRDVRHRADRTPGVTARGDFTEAEEPLRLFAAWFEDARKAEPADPEAMALATVDADGLPNVRMVLLKGFDQRGFVFYTNDEQPEGARARRPRQGGPRIPLEVAAAAGAAARDRRAGERRRGRCLFREPPAVLPDRRLGQQAVAAAREPARLREGDRDADGEICGQHGAAAAVLGRLPHRARGDGILARPSVPAA